MFIKLLLIIAIIVQTIATLFAVRLLRTTKYNAIWILFIMGFSVLSAERYMQLIIYNGGDVSLRVFNYTGVVVSVGLSVGVMYADKLFRYIEQLNRQRTLTSRRILSAVLRTEEQSRSSFSKDLHDGLGPLLSSAKMSLSALSHAKSEQERGEIVSNVTYAIDEAIRSVREISNNLSPHLLVDFGLSRAISTFIKKGAPNHTAKIRFETNLEAKRYNEDVEVILYRVICELINNTLKHAAASRVELSLQEVDGELLLEYSDDGVGFDPHSILDKGMGLSNISSRVNSLNGTFEIESGANAGMQARVIISVEPNIDIDDNGSEKA